MIPILRKSFVRAIYISIDVVCMYIAIFLACTIRAQTLPFEVNFVSILFSPENSFRFLFVFWMIAILLSLYARSLYQTRREMIESFELYELLKAIILATLVVVVAVYCVKVEGFPRTILAIGTVFHFIFLATWRYLKRKFIEYLVINGFNNFNVLIVGAGTVGRALYSEIQRRPGLGLKVIGFLDDQKENTFLEGELPVIGRLNDMSRIVRREFINIIFVAASLESTKFFILMNKAKELGVAVRVIPQGFEFMSREFIKYNIGFIPILEYSRERGMALQAGKRVFDFIVSLFLCILLLPMVILISLAVKFTSRGPVFYFSQRYGYGGRKFHMIKFRSMVDDADRALADYIDDNEVDGPIFKMRKDPRITSFGRFLRKSSLDELPQIFNVLKGDMSLVGPRPLPIHQVEKDDFRQLKRLEVRPGITGLWQIRGRSDVSFKRLVRWDIWYINNWSFWLDLNILMQTIPVVIKGKGAY